MLTKEIKNTQLDACIRKTSIPFLAINIFGSDCSRHLEITKKRLTVLSLQGEVSPREHDPYGVGPQKFSPKRSVTGISAQIGG